MSRNISWPLCNKNDSGTSVLCSHVRTLCDELFHGDLIPSDREHFPEVAADPRAGPGPGHTSEPAALGLRHSGKFLHGFAFIFCRQMQSSFSGTFTAIYRVAQWCPIYPIWNRLLCVSRIWFFWRDDWLTGKTWKPVSGWWRPVVLRLFVPVSTSTHKWPRTVTFDGNIILVGGSGH